MSIEHLTNEEKLNLCIDTLSRCLYLLEYDKQCGYGERARDCHYDITETLMAVKPDVLKVIKDKVNYDLCNGVDTNANRN